MIRQQVGMPTFRFCQLIGVPERTWRRWQARAVAGEPAKGPWPMSVAELVEPYVVKHAEAHPEWGHRKIWALCRYDGHNVSASTVERIMRRRGLLLERGYTAERKALATARRQAFLDLPDRPNMVWQLDFSEFETLHGGTWRMAGVADYYAKYEFGWHLATTQAGRDAIAAVELALAEVHAVTGRKLIELLPRDADGQVMPVRLVTDNGPAFRGAEFARFLAAHPELAHVRTRNKAPHTNGVRERAFGSLKYERLYREEITDGPMLAEHAQHYRHEFNHVRPHEALSWNRPIDVYLGRARPHTPNFPEPKNLPNS